MPARPEQREDCKATGLDRPRSRVRCLRPGWPRSCRPCASLVDQDRLLGRQVTMPRKATGTLIYTRGKGWCARIPVIVGYVDGKPVREKRWYELGTESRAVARRKVAKIIA